MQLSSGTGLVEMEMFVDADSSCADRPIHHGPRLRGVACQNISQTQCALSVNTRVRATDGNAGRLVGLTVEPASGSITHLLLLSRQGPAWVAGIVALPLSAVAEVSSEVVYTRSTRAAIAALAPAPVPRGRSRP
jgi:hypothetical protein